MLRPTHAAERRGYPSTVVEAVLVLAAPALAFFALQLRAMAPAGNLADPVMHSVYLWDPRDLVVRYVPRVIAPDVRRYIGPPAAYFRWGTRPGFLVPGRLAYLLFGAVPGFFAFRYVLALVAVVPSYLLLRRLRGRGAGALAIALIMTSPVILSAWGTDFPDSAVVSYLIGGTCCLVMPTAGRRARLAWVAAAGALFTLAVWALASSAIVIAPLLGVWGLLAARRSRGALVRGAAILAADFLAVTVALAVLSWALLGRFDFVLPTIQAVEFLGTPAQLAHWHSGSWAWAPYETYLLVLPAVAASAGIVLGRRWRSLPFATRVIAAATVLQLVVAAAGQFLYHFQLLEEHYLSSSMWAGATLTLALVLAEITGDLVAHRAGQWVPALLVVLVALASEVAPQVPGFTWAPVGLAVMAVAITAAGLAERRRASSGGRGWAAACAVVVVGALLALTVTPTVPHRQPSGTVYDPPSPYPGALGGPSATLVADYRIEAAVRRWVPNATYRGEQLVTCWSGEGPLTLALAGLFHIWINLLPSDCPDLTPASVAEINRRRAAQLVVFARRPIPIAQLVASVRPLRAVVAKRKEFASGSDRCWVWLVEFPRYLDHRDI